MHETRHIATLATLAVAMLVCGVTVHAQDTRTYQAIRIERPAEPGNYIRLVPPSTAITPYTLIWSGIAPIPSRYLTAVGTGTTYQLLYDTPTQNMVVTNASNNLVRDATTLENGNTATPGYYALDLQASRSSSSQTASANSSFIFGGRNNTTSAYLGGIGGGYNNTSSANSSVIIGGQNINNSAYRGAMLGGDNNNASANGATLFGGQNNVNSANVGMIGAGYNNNISGNTSTLFGGINNVNSANYGSMFTGINNNASGNQTTMLAGANNSTPGNMAIIVAGMNNTSSSNQNFIGAGYKNNAVGSQSVVWGADSNSTQGQYGVIMGGRRNRELTNNSFIGAGEENYISGGLYTVILGGYQNTISANTGTVTGGLGNSSSNQFNVIPGGSNFTLSSQNTFGYNATSASAISVSTSGVATINNANVWLASNDNTPRALRLYEQYNSAGAFPNGANYVAFVAPTSTQSDRDLTITLPDRVGTTAQWLTISSSTAPTTTTATLEWANAPSAPVVTTVAINANPTTLTAAQLNSAFLRLNATINIALGAEIRLANGDTDGRIVRIRAVHALWNLLVNDANNVNLRSNFTMTNGDTLTLVWDATNNIWTEISRTDF